jgi:dephospho-CoA kinase
MKTEMPFTLIGLVGKKRVGKDTAADILLQELGPIATKVAFADPLKDAVAALFGYTAWYDMERELGKEDPIPWLGGITLRRIYQTLGTEWARKMVHPEIWVKLMDRRIFKLQEQGYRVVVITDIRFDNEAEYLRSKFGSLIHIERPEPKEMKPWWTRYRMHLSERGLTPLPGELVIRNDNGLESYRVKVLSNLSRVLSRT